MTKRNKDNEKLDKGYFKIWAYNFVQTVFKET